MPYQETVQSRIQLATTASTSANLGNTLFITTNTYFSERLRSFTTFEEVRADVAIPSTSVAFDALRLAFSQPGANVPILLGRREADDLTITPDPVVDSADYGLTFEVINTTTQAKVTTVVSINSGVAATATSIATLLFTAIDSGVPVNDVTAVDNTGSVTITADSGFTFNAISLVRLLDTYATTETAATLLAAIQIEDNENWYYLECDDHSETFILAMASEIETTDSSNLPKQYHTSIQEANTIITLPSPATDTMGKLQEFEYNRTSCRWHDQADTLFPEIAATAFNGQFDPGTTTWKYMNNITGVSAAADLITGKPLSTAKQGFIFDRFGNWHGFERKVNFAHGGTVASGEYIDVIQAKDFLNDEIETQLLNLLLNQPGGKISFNAEGKGQVKNVIDGVLTAAVDSGILTGYEPTTIPDISEFADQAARILRDVDWVGYLAGAVHFIIVNGILTFLEEELS